MHGAALRPPQLDLVGTRVGATSIPFRINWSGGPPDLQRYELERSRGGHSFRSIPLPDPRSPTAPFASNPNNTFEFRVRAVSGTGPSPWAVSAPISVRAISESDPAVLYTGKWKRRTEGSPYGGALRGSSQAGASASLDFVGSDIGIVATTGPGRGTFEVVIDGATVGRVSLNAGSTTWRRVVFTHAFATPGPHTLRLVVVGDGRVDLDALLLIR